MHYLNIAALFCLSIGLLTSISILAGFHIFIAIPSLYALKDFKLNRLSNSTISLIILAVLIALSVVVNQDIIDSGYRGFFKSKYFFVGILSVFAFAKYPLTKKQIKILLHLFLITTTLATCFGLYNYFVGNVERANGTFGMVMNYAHNLSYFLVINTALVLYSNEVKGYVNKNFVRICLAINLLGLFFSYTRGAWIAFLAALPFFLFKKSKKLFLFICLGGCLAGAGAYFAAGDAMYRADGDQTRIGQWLGAIKAFQERPLTGVGYLNYEQICDEIKMRYDIVAAEFKGHAHNNFFEILATTGIFGMLSYLAWLIFWFIEMYKRDDFVAKAILPLIICFIAGGLTQSTIALGINLFFVMAVYALSVAKPKIVE